MFGQCVEKLFKAVQKEKGWREIPVGPIGAHILICTDHQRYSKAIDAALGGLYKSYVVTNSNDATKLRQIMQRTGAGHGVQIFTIKGERRFGPFAHPMRDLESKGYKTIDQVIEIENDLVYNTVVNFTNPQKLVVVENDVAYDVAFKGSSNWQRGAKMYNFKVRKLPHAVFAWYTPPSAPHTRPAPISVVPHDLHFCRAVQAHGCFPYVYRVALADYRR